MQKLEKCLSRREAMALFSSAALAGVVPPSLAFALTEMPSAVTVSPVIDPFILQSKERAFEALQVMKDMRVGWEAFRRETLSGGKPRGSEKEWSFLVNCKTNEARILFYSVVNEDPDCLVDERMREAFTELFPEFFPDNLAAIKRDCDSGASFVGSLLERVCLRAGGETAEAFGSELMARVRSF